VIDILGRPDLQSLWLIAAGSVVGLLAAQELGYRAYRFLQRRAAEPPEKTDGINYMLSAALALLGLLIAFTFSMAVDRYDARRALVVEEANAVGTVYLRLQLLDEPARGVLSRDLIAYTKARSDFLAAARNSPLLTRADAETARTGTQFWNDLAPVLKARPGDTMSPALLTAANAMLDSAASAQAAMNARLPDAVMTVLLVYALVSAVLMGFALGSGGRRHLAASVLLFMLVSMSISLIVDLDQPRRGTVQVSAEPFLRAAAQIEATEAAAPR